METMETMEIEIRDRIFSNIQGEYIIRPAMFNRVWDIVRKTMVFKDVMAKMMSRIKVSIREYGKVNRSAKVTEKRIKIKILDSPEWYEKDGLYVDRDHYMGLFPSDNPPKFVVNLKEDYSTWENARIGYVHGENAYKIEDTILKKHTCIREIFMDLVRFLFGYNFSVSGNHSESKYPLIFQSTTTTDYSLVIAPYMVETSSENPTKSKSQWHYVSKYEPEKVNPGDLEMEKSIDLFKSWHQREPQRILSVDVPDRKGRIRKLGKIVRIDYISDKWHKGKYVYYWHPIEKNHPRFGIDDSGQYYCLGKQPAKDVGLVEYEGRNSTVGKAPP